MQSDPELEDTADEGADESRIVDLALKKDPDALGSLYDVVYPPLYRLLCFSLRDEEQAQEIASAVIPTVLASIPYLEEGAPSLRGWMMATAWNLLQRDHKHALPSVGYHLPPHFLDEATVNTLEYADSADSLAAALRQLPAAWQNFLALRFVAGLARSEVAYVLGRRPAEIELLEEDALEELGYWLKEFSG